MTEYAVRAADAPVQASQAARPEAPAAELSEDSQRHLEHLRAERRLAAPTLRSVEASLRQLEAFAAAQPVALRDAQVHHIRRWAATLHGRGAAPRSIAIALSAWRGFYRWLSRDGLVAINPADGVRAPKAGRPLPKALSVDHAMALADHAAPDATADPRLEARDRAIVELLYGCGLRVAELVGLDVAASASARGWIDAGDAEAQVLGKGGKRRSVPVGRTALEALAAWRALRDGLAKPDEPSLFVTRHGTRLSASQIRTRLEARAQQAGLPTHVHPHMLRHSYASHLLQSSGDLRAVQELLGHANITTTQVYTKLDFQHLAKAYDAAHPRAKRKGGGPA